MGLSNQETITALKQGKTAQITGLLLPPTTNRSRQNSPRQCRPSTPTKPHMKTKEEIRLEEPISVMCLHGRYLRIDETYCQELLQKSTSQMNCAPLHIQSPSLHHYSARPGHKFEWSWDIPWVFLTAKGDGHSVLAAQSYTQHTSFLLLNGTATLRCHITQGWKEPLQLCIH